MNRHSRNVYSEEWTAQEWCDCFIVRVNKSPYASDDIVAVTPDREFAEHLVKAQQALLEKQAQAEKDG